MTDQQAESALEVPENGELPLPEISGDSGAKRTSAVGAVDTTKLVAELAPLLREVLVKDEDFIRASQSVKDKRLRVLDDIDPEALRQFNLYLKKHGGDEDTAIREMLIDRRLLGTTPSEERPGKAESEAPAREPDPRARVREILDNAGIPYDDAEYKAIVTEYAGQGITEDFVADVRALARTKSKSAREVSAAAVVSEGTGASAPTSSGLEQQYIQKLRAAHGNPVEIRRLRAEYEAKGVDVSNALKGVYPSR